MHTVSIVKAPPQPSMQDIRNTVEKSLSYLGGLESLVPKHASVLIKPNIGTDEDYLSGLVTDWRVVEAIIALLQEYGIQQIKIAESSIVGKDTQLSFEAAGYNEVAKRTGAVLVDLKKDEIQEVAVPNGLMLSKIKVHKTVADSDFIINVPKLKTISATPVSFSMKNLKGVIPDPEKRRFHNLQLNHCIVDLNQAVKSDLIIVDGIIGSDFYQPKETNVIIAGKNVVSVDAVACRVIGIDPYTVEYLVQAEKLKMGSASSEEIMLCGEKLENVIYPFTKPVEQNKFALLFPDINIIFGDSCSGCTTSLYRALDILKNQGRLSQLAGITIAMGTNPVIENCERVLYVGNCTKTAAAEGYAIGCPPIPSEIAEFLYAGGK